MTQISITRALAQVKSLNDRIQRGSNANFITTLVGGKHGTGVSEQEASGILTANLQSVQGLIAQRTACLLYTSPSPRDLSTSRMPSSA